MSGKSWSEYWPPVAPAGHSELLAVRVVSRDRRHVVEEMPGSDGRFPVLSCAARVNSRMVCCPRVWLKSLHIRGTVRILCDELTAVSSLRRLKEGLTSAHTWR